MEFLFDFALILVYYSSGLSIKLCGFLKCYFKQLKFVNAHDCFFLVWSSAFAPFLSQYVNDFCVVI